MTIRGCGMTSQSDEALFARPHYARTEVYVIEGTELAVKVSLIESMRHRRVQLTLRERYAPDMSEGHTVHHLDKHAHIDLPVEWQPEEKERNWTTTVPTKSGTYWFKFAHQRIPPVSCLLKVKVCDGVTYAHDLNEAIGTSMEARSLRGEWSTKEVEPPEED